MPNRVSAYQVFLDALANELEILADRISALEKTRDEFPPINTDNDDPDA